MVCKKTSYRGSNSTICDAFIFSHMTSKGLGHQNLYSWPPHPKYDLYTELGLHTLTIIKHMTMFYFLACGTMSTTGYHGNHSEE